MIATFGKNIKGAFTSGQEVKAIYSKGVKVWPSDEPYYIKWTPENATGTFKDEYDNTYRLEDYNGEYRSKDGVIAFKAFYNCYQIKTIDTNFWTTRYGAFRNCTFLKSVNMPECRYIADECFFDTSLTYLNAPKCEGIGDKAIHAVGMTSLSLPVCSYMGNEAIVAPNLETLVLGYDGVVSAENPFGVATSPNIYVPATLVDEYKQAPFWGDYDRRFADIGGKIFPIPEA